MVVPDCKNQVATQSVLTFLYASIEKMEFTFRHMFSFILLFSNQMLIHIAKYIDHIR